MKKVKIRKSLTRAFDIFGKNWAQILSIFALIAFINLVPQMFGGYEFNEYTGEFISHYSPLLGFISWVASVYVGIGFTRYMLDLVDNKEVKIKDIFYRVESIEHFAFVLLTGIISGVIIFTGTLLLLIPGIYAALCLMFAKYYSIENKGDSVEALKFSYEITKGVKWKLLVFVLSLIAVNILGLLAFGVGLIVTIPVTSIAVLVVYRALEKNNTKKSKLKMKEEILEEK